jgi:hypothetical protein
MNGRQMSHLLSMDNYTAIFFKGFAMQDTEHLNHCDEKPALYIINTDVESGPGKHWCAAFYFKNCCEFFDPFGMDPRAYGLENILLSRNVKVIKANNRCLQNVLSAVCGHHCIFYAYHRCRNYQMKDIIKLYQNDTTWNDHMVQDFTVQFGGSYYASRML